MIVCVGGIEVDVDDEGVVGSGMPSLLIAGRRVCMQIIPQLTNHSRLSFCIERFVF